MVLHEKKGKELLNDSILRENEKNSRKVREDRMIRSKPGGLKVT